MKIFYKLGKSFIYTQGDRLKKPNHGYGNLSGEKFYPAVAGCITISKSNCAKGIHYGEKLGPKLNAFINSAKR